MVWWSDSSGQRVAKSLRTLYDEVNALAPHRHTGDDGTIGDARHQAEHSDHNPDSEGVVRALDITHDPANGCDCGAILGAIVNARDDRVSYLIFNRKIYNPKIQNWAGRPYNGSDPHTGHIHVSVVADDKADNTRQWTLNATIKPTLTPAPVPPPTGSAKAGVYGWFDGDHHWEDDGDKAGSAALGVSDSRQGHAFYCRSTLGKWFYLTSPHGKTVLSQQTDIGPSTWTGRGIDIHARVADAVGYTQDNFPTNSVWSWSPASPPAGTEHLTPQQQAAAYTSIQFVEPHMPDPTPAPPPVPIPIPAPHPSGSPDAVTDLLQQLSEFLKRQNQQPPNPNIPPAPSFNMSWLIPLITWFIAKLPQAGFVGIISSLLMMVFDVMGPAAGSAATKTGQASILTSLGTFGLGLLNNWLSPKDKAK